MELNLYMKDVQTYLFIHLWCILEMMVNKVMFFSKYIYPFNELLLLLLFSLFLCNLYTWINIVNITFLFGSVGVKKEMLNYVRCCCYDSSKAEADCDIACVE
jgi:hypothetical protein